jgi:hypothetical protein
MEFHKINGRWVYGRRPRRSLGSDWQRKIAGSTIDGQEFIGQSVGSRQQIRALFRAKLWAETKNKYNAPRHARRGISLALAVKAFRTWRNEMVTQGEVISKSRFIDTLRIS